MSDVDVIVLDLDGGDLLTDCLDSLDAQTILPQRVIVLDNGSRVPVAHRLGERPGLRVEILRSETNLGFTGGVNEAFRHVTSTFVALINNDVVLDPDWLESMLEVVTDVTVGAVQSVMRRDHATVDGAGIDVSDGTIRQIGHGAPLGSALSPAWGVSATASWTTVVLPVAKATHRGSQSAARLGARAQRLRTRNRYFVARLHPRVLRIGALVWEDLKLIPRGRASLRGMIEGLCGRVKGEE